MTCGVEHRREKGNEEEKKSTFDLFFVFFFFLCLSTSRERESKIQFFFFFSSSTTFSYFLLSLQETATEDAVCSSLLFHRFDRRHASTHSILLSLRDIDQRKKTQTKKAKKKTTFQ